MGAVFEHPVDVRWRDVDALGHVNHAVFLTYLAEGRDVFFTQTLGVDPLYVVVRIELDLRAEVRLPGPAGDGADRGRAPGNDESYDPRNDPCPIEGGSGRGARRHGSLGCRPPEASPVQPGRARPTDGRPDQ